MSIIDDLKTELASISNLAHAVEVLCWDRDTYMPEGGARQRASAISELAAFTHARATSDAFGTLVAGAQREADSLAEDSVDFLIVRMSAYDYERLKKLPNAFVAESSEAHSLAQSAWVDAKGKSDFAAFAPHLEKNLQISRRTVEYYGYVDQPYDALLGQFEPKMLTKDVQKLFDQVRPVVVDLVRKISQRPPVDRSPLFRNFDEGAQERFAVEAITRFGYDFRRGRIDRTVHPFEVSFGRDDCRITTKYNVNDLPSALLGTIHECGHAMYEQNIGEDIRNTGIDNGCSNSVHESQSRLWENLVGRSESFWRRMYPSLQAQFPGVLDDVSLDWFVRAINTVQPSLIRIESDEVTYNLHIILRFELEQDLLMDRINVKDAPEAWNAKMQEYLGITPPSDAEGVLQDVHWAMGGMGYFPTYSLGNFLSVQLYDTALEQEPAIGRDIAQGEYGSLFNWLERNLWRYGRRYFPQETIVRATGRPLETGPYIAYLQRKFGALYGL
jgi:carboxypeptidase Taq